MKKFSITARLFMLAAILTPFPALAQTSLPAPTHCAFLPEAPDQHTVVRGDTLWGISGKFLQHPWCWPQVWGLNREQIHHPHWIYPGQIVYLDRVAGRLRLGKRTGEAERDDATGQVRLSPQIRSESLDKEAIPAIASAAIDPFLAQPLIVEENELQNAPRIMATQEGRVYLGKEDKAYVRGDLQGATLFQAFRPGHALKDPVTKQILGYEAVYLGTLKLDRAAQAANEAHRFIVMSSKEEMGIGDRLLPMPVTPILNYMPHPPEHPVDARIVSIYGGVMQAGPNQIVTVNRGAQDGLDIGSVLQLSRFGPVVADSTDHKNAVKLPDDQYGSLFIFRVFKHIAYGLVMQVTDLVQVGDVANSPQ